MMERSLALKSPSIHYHLAGTKKVRGQSRQLAVSLFGNTQVGKMRNTYEHQRVSDGKIQITTYSDTETGALSRQVVLLEIEI